MTHDLAKELPGEPRFGDVKGTAQHADAVRRDQGEALAALTDNPVGGRIALEIARTHAYVRKISFGVLKELEEAGISEAVELAERLGAIDRSKNPLRADLSAVASDLDEERLATKNTAEGLRLRHLGSLAHVTAFVSVARATWETGPGSAAGLELRAYTDQELVAADIPSGHREALTLIHQRVYPQ